MVNLHLIPKFSKGKQIVRAGKLLTGPKARNLSAIKKGANLRIDTKALTKTKKAPSAASAAISGADKKLSLTQRGMQRGRQLSQQAKEKGKQVADTASEKLGLGASEAQRVNGSIAGTPTPGVSAVDPTSLKGIKQIQGQYYMTSKKGTLIPVTVDGDLIKIASNKKPFRMTKRAGEGSTVRLTDNGSAILTNSRGMSRYIDDASKLDLNKRILTGKGWATVVGAGVPALMAAGLGVSQLLTPDQVNESAQRKIQAQEVLRQALEHEVAIEQENPILSEEGSTNASEKLQELTKTQQELLDDYLDWYKEYYQPIQEAEEKAIRNAPNI